MNDPPDHVIQFKNVSYRLENGLELLHNLTLEIERGETLVLLGRSGSGKTTTLKLINHLLSPSGGVVLVDGRSLCDWDLIRLRRMIGYVIQEVGLFPHFTVERNIALVPQLERWSAERIGQRVQELLRLVGLDPQLASRHPRELSGGQRQRVGVARALGADPPILLMDEPFGAIDRIARERLQNEFLRIQREVRKTVIFVTHDIDEAIKLGDRIAIMNAGRLEQYDTPAAILAKPASDLVIDLLGPDRGLKRLSVTPIDLNALESPPIVHPDESLADARSRLDRKWTRLIVLDRDGRPVGELDGSQLEGSGPVRERARPLDA